jgi:hypothetical protein
MMKNVKTFSLLILSLIGSIGIYGNTSDERVEKVALELQQIAQDSAILSEEDLEERMTVLVESHTDMTVNQFLAAFSLKNNQGKNASEIAYDLYEKTNHELCKKIGRCFRTEWNIFNILANELNAGHLTILETNEREDLQEILLNRSNEIETQ